MDRGFYYQNLIDEVGHDRGSYLTGKMTCMEISMKGYRLQTCTVTEVRDNTLWLSTENNDKPLTIPIEVARHIQKGNQIRVLFSRSDTVLRVYNISTDMMYSLKFKSAQSPGGAKVAASLLTAGLCAIPVIGAVIGLFLGISFIIAAAERSSRGVFSILGLVLMTMALYLFFAFEALSSDQIVTAYVVPTLLTIPCIYYCIAKQVNFNRMLDRVVLSGQISQEVQI